MSLRDSPTTHPSLLLRVRDARDVNAWGEFADLYGPLIHRFARSNGFQDADAADLVQDVLSAVAASIGSLNYNPQLGRFRSWLFTIARNRMRNLLRRTAGHARATGDSGTVRLLNNQSEDHSELEDRWELEYQERLIQWAMDIVRRQFAENTWQAFVKTAIEARPPQEVADELDLSVGAVYIAKSRVVSRLKETIAKVGE